MALDWFAFNVKAYMGDTAHLTTEEHGAYLLLMLAYYSSEKPLPATDRALSSITKLPMDRWLECKPALAPFFDERNCGGGMIYWAHARIEAEIADGYAKQKVRSDNARRAVSARYQHTERTRHVEQMPSTLTLTNNSPSVVLTVDKGEKGDNAPTEPDFLKRTEAVKPPETPVEEPAPAVEIPAEEPEPAMTPIDPSFRPSGKLKLEALSFMDESTLHIEVQKFVFDHQAKGSLSANWDASFGMWLARAKQFAVERDKKRGKPRVELNHSPDSRDVKINWAWHLERWLKNESNWSFRTAGPEPGQPGCRVPSDMLERFNIDPATGRRKREAS
jgi:uncharacterized protein YdaU (DUF1376 family)